MKNIKNTLLLLLTFSFVLSASASTGTIESEEIMTTDMSIETTSIEVEEVSPVKIVDSDILELELSETISSTGVLFGDVKLFETVEIYSASKSGTGGTKVTLDLDREILPGVKYSLLSVSPVDSAIDFTLSGTTQGEVVENENLIDGEEGIASLMVINSNQIELTFNTQVIDGPELEFELLKEITVSSIDNIDGEKINLKLESSLLENNPYILMFISLTDELDNDVYVGEGVFDFSTPESFGFDIEEEIIEETVNETLEESLNTDEFTEEEVVIEEGTITEEVIIDTEIDMNAAMDIEPTLISVEDAAMNVSETPDTGASTFIMLLLTFILSIFYYTARRKA